MKYPSLEYIQKNNYCIYSKEGYLDSSFQYLSIFFMTLYQLTTEWPDLHPEFAY